VVSALNPWRTEFGLQAKMVITSDGGFRRGSIVPLKKNVDDALMIKRCAGQVAHEHDREK